MHHAYFLTRRMMKSMENAFYDLRETVKVITKKATNIYAEVILIIQENGTQDTYFMTPFDKNI